MRPLILLAPLLLAAASSSSAASPAPRTNFVLCMTDDQGWGDTGYNGNPVLRTPNLDAMAAAGVRFDRFYAAYPVCSPTRGSVLSGRNPSRYRNRSWGYDLPLREVTVAEILRGAGYSTGHFGKWHLGGVPNADGITGRGVPESFDSGPRHPGNQGFDVWFTAGNWFDADPPAGTFWRNGAPVPALKGDTSDLVMTEALEFIRARAGDRRPFLCVIWFPSPHGPWRALPGDRAPYAAQGASADFLGEMAAVDRAMGHLRDELSRLGLRDDTLVWFNSDNGAAGGSAGPLTGGKGSLWEGGIRTPGLIEWPARVRRAIRTPVPAGTVDILPTLCDIAGVTVPADAGPLDGESLLPVIEGRATARRDLLTFEMTRPADGRPLVAAAIDQQWKLLRVVNQMRRAKDGTGELLPAGDHLFDVETDPGETRDLSREHPEVLARLRARLDAAQRSFVESASVYSESPAVTRLEPRLLVRAGGVPQPLVDRLAFPTALWTGTGAGWRRHADGALQLGGDEGQASGVHHAMNLTNVFLQFSVRLGPAGRAALELGPAGAVVADVIVEADAVTVRSRVGPGAVVAELRTVAEAVPWRRVLVEFAPGEIGIAVEGLPFLRAPTAGLSLQRREGFALTRLAGDVAFRDVWATAGEPPATEGMPRERGRRGKTVKAGVEKK